MKRDILIAVLSAAVIAVLGFAIGQSMGFFKQKLNEDQVEKIAEKILNEDKYRKKLLSKMKESGEFQGKIGPRGSKGEQGLPGPNKQLVCRTSPRVKGRTASCPNGFIVTECSAGGNRGSIKHQNNSCRTDDDETDWTEARCCKLQ